jgi:ABC-2 type transport system ATP-binding protein
VEVRVAGGSELVAELVGDLAAVGAPVGRLEVRRPTLDDVFLDLTGRSLREAHAAETTPTHDETSEVAA